MRHAPLAPAVSAALARFRAAIAARFGPRVREMVLFGSQARGEANEESDVDVLVVIDGLDEWERRDVLDLAWRAGIDDDDYVIISPLPYSTDQAADLRARERRLMREIARDGVSL